MTVEKSEENTLDTKRLAYNAYMRDYNRRRRERKQRETELLAQRKYNDEILGGSKHE